MNTVYFDLKGQSGRLLGDPIYSAYRVESENGDSDREDVEEEKREKEGLCRMNDDTITCDTKSELNKIGKLHMTPEGITESAQPYGYVPSLGETKLSDQITMVNQNYTNTALAGIAGLSVVILGFMILSR